MIFKAKRIVKKFSESNILDSIDFSIDKGQIISIQGASGSGKTTLLNVLGLLDDVSSGNVKYYNGLDYNNFNSFQRVNTIGYIFQFHHLLSEFNIAAYRVGTPKNIVTLCFLIILDTNSGVGLSEFKTEVAPTLIGKVNALPRP